MFPIFRLDRLTRDEVLCNLTPIELFNLSLCSKNSLLNVKDMIRRTNKNWFPMVSIQEYCSVGVICERNGEKPIEWAFFVEGTGKLRHPIENQSTGVINGIQFTGVIFENQNIMETYWENEDLGFKTLIGYIEDLYGKYADLYFNDGNSNKLIEMLNWTNNRQKSIENAKIKLKSMTSDNDLAAVLDRLKLVKVLELEMMPGLRFIENNHREYKFDSLNIHSGYWVNVQHLLSMKCPIIKAEGTLLTNTDMNFFLKQWMQDLNPTLRSLGLRVMNLDFSVILSDIPHTKSNRKIMYKDRRVSMAFDICPSNGISALIVGIPPDFVLNENENINFALNRNENINFAMWVRS